MKYAIYLIFLTLFVSSCTEEVNFDLNDSNPKITIDAFLTTKPAQQEIYISRSTSYFSGVASEKIRGASITLTGEGESYVFSEHAPGLYVSDVVLALQVSKTYTLSVNVDGDIYTATSYIKPLVYPLDTIVVAQLFDTIPIIHKIDSSYSLFIARQENPGVGDFYLGKYFINNRLQTDTIREYAWTDDVFIDGQYIVFPVYYIDQHAVHPGDSIRFELYSINKLYSDYLVSVLVQTDFKGGLFDGPSANVKGNFSNGALGFFMACDISIAKTVVH